jgi:hypothetical protein
MQCSCLKIYNYYGNILQMGWEIDHSIPCKLHFNFAFRQIRKFMQWIVFSIPWVTSHNLCVLMLKYYYYFFLNRKINLPRYQKNVSRIFVSLSISPLPQTVKRDGRGGCHPPSIWPHGAPPVKSGISGWSFKGVQPERFMFSLFSLFWC